MKDNLKYRFTIFVLLSLVISLFIKLGYFNYLFQGAKMIDFEAYYLLSKDVRSGINPYKVSHMQTLGPPSVILTYLPFSFFTSEVASSLFFLINIIFGFLSLLLLAGHYFQKNKFISFLGLSTLFFSAFPTRLSIENGQPMLLVTFLVTAVIIRPKNIINAPILATLTMVKTYFGLTIFSFLRKEKIISLKTIYYLVSFIIISFLLIKPQWYQYYFETRLPRLAFDKSQVVGLDYYNQSLNSTLQRVGLESTNSYQYVLVLIVSALIIYLFSNFLLSIVIATIISAVSWQHYFTVFFPIFVSTFFAVKKNFKKVIILTFAFLLWWIELPHLHKASSSLINGVLASHYFVTGLVLAGLIATQEWASKWEEKIKKSIK